MRVLIAALAVVASIVFLSAGGGARARAPKPEDFCSSPRAWNPSTGCRVWRMFGPRLALLRVGTPPLANWLLLQRGPDAWQELHYVYTVSGNTAHAYGFALGSARMTRRGTRTVVEIRSRLTRDDNGVDYDDERLPVRRVARYVTRMLQVCSAVSDAPFVCAKPIEYERNASSFARSGQARPVFSWRGRPVIADDGTVRFEHVVSSSGTDPDGWVPPSSDTRCW